MQAQTTTRTAAKAPVPVVSPVVHDDQTVTFRYRNAGAAKVTVNVDWLGKPVAMVKDAEGVWSATVGPLAPEIYTYAFKVDGQEVNDPGNLIVSANLFYHDSLVEVPGDRLEPWDAKPVAHGELHRHLYTTKVIEGLTQNQEPYVVYTPPGYDEHAQKPYPVLYLLHGWSQTEMTWTETLKANFILDGLLAEGKMTPMVVVMPLGYGQMSFMQSFDVWQHPEPVERNRELFERALLTEIMPQVEAEYRVARDREGRAIAGLSMGGLESLTIGLGNPQTFAWVGGMSAAIHLFGYPPEHPGPIPGLDSAPAAKTAGMKLVWIACGTSDALIEPNRRFAGYLKGLGLPVTEVETPGAHVSQVWRENLLSLAPLLFR